MERKRRRRQSSEKTNRTLRNSTRKLEFQRDWARKETYDAVMAIVEEHSGAYRQGVEYANTMLHKMAPYRAR